MTSTPSFSFNFNTHRYEVLASFGSFFKLLQKAKSAGEKFDILLAYTYQLNAYDVWVHDHECGWGMHKPLAKLAKTWKLVLANDDAALGISEADSFTRAGAVEFLKGFQKKVEAIDQDEEPDITFAFA